MNKLSKWLQFQSCQEWETYLENHLSLNEIWIEIQKKNSRKQGINLTDAVNTALCFGWIDGVMYSIDTNCFIIRMSPRRINSPWSLINKNRAIKLIEDGRMRESGFKSIEIAKSNGWWDKAYTSQK